MWRVWRISAVEHFVSRFTGPEGAKRIKRVRWRFLYLPFRLFVLAAPRSLPRAHPYTTLAINSFLCPSLSPLHSLRTTNIGYSRQKIWAAGAGGRGIAARGSADDYGVVNLLGSSAPSAVLCTASRWLLKKTAPAGTCLVSHRLVSSMFIN